MAPAAAANSDASPAKRHVAVIPFPFSSHTSVLAAIASTLAAATGPAAHFSFLTTAGSVRAGALSGAVQVVELDDGLSRGGAELPEPKRIEAFLAAAAAGALREGLRKAEAAAGGAPVSCLVSDAFVWLTAELAEEIGVPWVAVWPAGAPSLVAHVFTDEIRETIGVGEEATARANELISFVPGLGAHRVCDLPTGVVTGNFNYVINDIVHHAGKVVPRASALAINTLAGLDPGSDAALTAAVKSYLPIGPFHLLSTLFGHARPADDPHGCLRWLDCHNPNTVVYVCFGTVAIAAATELQELALGLEESGTPFLWSLKESAWPHLPAGFLDKTVARGLVVGWAPQVDVLQHPAVGAFINHAGWNSVLEGITTAVPMACRPFFGDHPTIARCVSDVWGNGVSLGSVVTRSRVASAVRALLEGEEGKRAREKSRILKSMADRAFDDSGSSKESFNRLVEIVVSGCPSSAAAGR